jgi:hypothetical protein
MSTNRNPARARNPKAASITVGFRLDAAVHQELAQRAEKQGLSPHELARNYVEEMLDRDVGATLFRIEECLAGCIESLGRLKQNIASTALLIATERCSEEDAKDWVAKNFV